MLIDRRKPVKITTPRRAVTTLAATCLMLCVASAAVARQGGTARYVYDENGRLHAVLSPSGEAVVYDYDAAGNVRAVRRLGADALIIFTFTPPEGIYGDLVTIVGVGFGAGVSGVSFNGTAARVVEVTPTSVLVEVPAGATTGTITVTTPRGSVNTATPFTVRGVRVSPPSAFALFGGNVQFTALVGTSGDPAVAWSVNGVPGGNSSAGTITSAGLYTAPAQVGTFAVRATLVGEPDLFGEAVVTVRDPSQVTEMRAAGVSVSRGQEGGTTTAAATVGVQSGLAQGTTRTSPTSSVSVQYGFGGPSSQLMAPFVSVDYGYPDKLGTVFGNVSVATGPHVASVAPAAAVRGSSVALTITGANLAGASAIRFISSAGLIALPLTVTNIVVNADGTTLTATLNVPATSVTPGQYVVVVMSPAGDSLTTPGGGNLLQIN